MIYITPYDHFCHTRYRYPPPPPPILQQLSFDVQSRFGENSVQDFFKGRIQFVIKKESVKFVGSLRFLWEDSAERRAVFS